MMMKIGIIGAYGGQGKRILSICFKEFDIEYYVYEHDCSKKRQNIAGINYEIKYELEELLFCDGIIIAAPTSEHYSYLKYFYDREYAGYIFCEKPVVESEEELQAVESFSDKIKKKIMIGFNLRYSVYSDILSGKGIHALGNLLYCNIISGHGLGFKDFYANSWRNDEKKTHSGIFETVSIHYLDLFIHRYGIPVNVMASHEIMAPNGRVWDNSMFSAAFAEGIALNIFNSYTSPFIQSTRFVFENGIVEIDDKEVRAYYPRDSFDTQGRFAAPPLAYIWKDTENDIWEASQKKILLEFYSSIVKKREFDLANFERSLSSTEYVIRASSKRR